MTKRILALLIGAIIAVTFYSCNKVDSFTLGQELVNTNPDVFVTDTCTIRAYTFKSDSVATSQTGVALVGKYIDKSMANITIKASSYIDFALPNKPDMPINDPKLPWVFDSLTLNTHYSRYSYGDTATRFTIEAYRLSERIDNKISNGYLFNSTSVAYSDFLGRKTIASPRPHKKDSIKIRLEDWLGKEMFNKIINRDAQFENISNFSDYFSGIVLTSPSTNNCILGFSANDTSMYMRFYYHRGDQKSTLTFKMKDKTHQFNQITPDFSTSTYTAFQDNPPKKLRDNISSDSTGNQTFAQAGIGLETRLEFPYLKKLMVLGNIKILNAELILSPEKKSYSMISLPDTIILNSLDESNVSKYTLTSSSGVPLIPRLHADFQYKENTYYRFDLTNYISSVFTDNTDLIPALGLSFNGSQEFSTLTRVVLDYASQSPNKTKLKITFWRY